MCSDGQSTVSCSSRPLGESVPLLKYFLGGGFGLEDVGFLTKISKDFFSLSGGWPSCFSQSRGPDVATGSAPGSCPRGKPCVLASRSDGCCPPPLLGLPPGDVDMQLLSLLERVMTFGALRGGAAQLLSRSLPKAGRPCQLLSSLLMPAGKHSEPHT